LVVPHGDVVRQDTRYRRIVQHQRGTVVKLGQIVACTVALVSG
jgi:hypothetical protein